MLKAKEVKNRMNIFGSEKRPFLFIVDFEKENGYFIDNPLNNSDILFKLGDISNVDNNRCFKTTVNFSNNPISFNEYKKSFDDVYSSLLTGYSFLTNLTFRTKIDINISLAEIYHRSNSQFKLLVKDKFVCFSPECFVKIINNKISTYPMKGTIDASVLDAENKILNDYKETCEHYTIVDLMRNDLNQIANNVRVEKFRYLDLINTNNGSIYQVSSKITGDLDTNFNRNIGDLIFNLLPAGSISGAPKESTINIISKAEKDKRGFYTGVFGYFDGENLNSAVIIRYIEKEEENYFFRSGGGITINSNSEEEYEELIKKIYLPF